MDNSDNDTIYKKLPDGTFKCIGREFQGFPSNGVWWVKDGSQSLIYKLDYELMPPFLPALASLENECSSYIIDSVKGKAYSFAQVANLASAYYSSIITKADYPEAFL